MGKKEGSSFSVLSQGQCNSELACFLLFFVLFLAMLIAEFAVLFDGEYCIIYLIILPLLKHKNIPAHQLILHSCICLQILELPLLKKMYVLKIFCKKKL